ncbi:N-methyl-L-tryptophan oxidase [Streptomyces hainanensis]|uniref:N-methyl-L-tryptophan oxidase n=1 Tax=Streptomyces hainanensis TaxID=402648 RepID=A0A4R4TPQ6_9ACTN|nr:N-methyl-L-tryptophan oxidase [Streptomyces hainanensis]TDC77163.1 N-methyl-L-tryptophan oxidase [Streptomyces hainanensis]
MTTDVEIAVVGAGLMGSATAWAASRRGRSVALLEQFAIGHAHGSSHGSARIVRRAYHEPHYVRLTGRAMVLWRELEVDADQRLLRITGGVDHGPVRAPERIAATLAECGVEHELLPPAEAERRWPGLRFAGPVLHHPEAGTVDADAAVAAFTTLAERRGAEVRAETPVRRIVVEGAERVRVETDAGPLTARRVVVAAGAWVAGLLGDLVPLPPLTVTQQQIFHFPRRDPAASERWPVIIHDEADLAVYSLPGGRDGGPGGGWKAAAHRGGVTTAETRDGVVDPAVRAGMVDYVRSWLPGLTPEPFNEATCLYTSTPSEDFLLDRVGPVVVCSPCSGHGAKFAPLIGEVAADLAAGLVGPDRRFTLAGHRAVVG